LTADCRENEFIDIMEQMPKEVEFSSLPKMNKGKGWQVTISVASQDEIMAKEAFNRYITLLEEKKIPYRLEDER